MIDKEQVRIGSINLASGSYGRWLHLSCWRVPSSIWLGLPDPDSTLDVAAFEGAISSMNTVLFIGYEELDHESKQLVILHIMDKKNWARLTKRKVKDEEEAHLYPNLIADASAPPPPGPSSSSTGSTMKREFNQVDENEATNAMAVRKARPEGFVVPVPGRGLAVANAFQGQRFVLTGVFPEGIYSRECSSMIY